MTPAARLAAGIGVLDAYLAGAPLEKTLTNWARASRYAGSKDRAAVRDIVFDCVRQRLSFAARGGAETGRGLALGWAAENHADPGVLFGGQGYGPTPVTDQERVALSATEVAKPHVRLDCPDWLIDRFSSRYGDQHQAILTALQSRAPTYLRVNLSNATRAAALDRLLADDIETEIHLLCPTALKVTTNPRRISMTTAWADGLVELQDAASQAVCASLPAAGRVLDFCAGGGGKALALADRGDCAVFAHDIDPKRMSGLEARAVRAGVEVVQMSTKNVTRDAPYDLVLCDVPCSGSGAWRRNPEGKWALTDQRLQDLCDMQDAILAQTCDLVSEQGMLAYTTCSLLPCENEDRVAQFIQNHPSWRCVATKQYTPLDGGDGFFSAHLTRSLR